MSMLGLFKRKLTVDELAGIFARVTIRFLRPLANPAIARLIAEYSDAGANSAFMNIEVGAFYTFMVWVGSARALAEERITQKQFEGLQEAFWTQLSREAFGSGVDDECELNTGVAFTQFVDQRIAFYTYDRTETDPERIQNSIAEAFCNCLGRPDAPASLKYIVRREYRFQSADVFKRITDAKLAAIN